MLAPLIKKTWAFEKIDKIKNQFYEKFDAILGKLSTHDTALASLASNDTSLLQTLIYLVERSQEAQRSRGDIQRRLGALQAAIAEAGEDAGRQATDLRAAIGRAEQAIAALEPRLASVEALQERQSRSRRNGFAAGIMLVDTPHYEHFTPEVGLMAHLAGFLPCRTAIDIGANVGDVSEALLDAGLEVHAFEPLGPTFEKLQNRLGGCARFHAHREAVGGADGGMDLHLVTDMSPNGVYKDASLYSSLLRHAVPSDLPFTKSVQVPVRSLHSLHASGEIPAEIGLVKIDTEGFDLEVIRGMGDHRYPVVSAEFWDEKMAFGKAGALNRLDMLVGEMRARGYPWHLVVYRVWGSDEVAFYCNLAHSVEGAWGNVFFFQDHQLFTHAREWGSATLPAAYFREVPRATSAGRPSVSPDAVAVR